MPTAKHKYLQKFHLFQRADKFFFRGKFFFIIKPGFQLLLFSFFNLASYGIKCKEANCQTRIVNKEYPKQPKQPIFFFLAGRFESAT